MAELATIARPYAEALYRVAGANAAQLADQIDALAAVAAEPQVRQFAANPKVSAEQVFELFTSVIKSPLGKEASNFLRTAIDNDRVAAIPEIATQLRSLINAAAGAAEARIVSAYPLTDDQLAQLLPALEKRFGRKLNAKVEVEPALIGGVRVVVGDEVLDTSVKARLERMKVALTA
ncbi:F0F1 ATP synthase subunit delta [Caldimonas caldifontis]|uniref:ATP synthase subunit delta n=1 Tax=Caldimonas caldifontis TaxID=1452508 RepID=A0A2S5SQY8_9BURK|nr:F0F1 ATP synthase subunit delta [Caldimonas caldifontis]PPE65152.1 F0F1 ATP synthase subunit delta [Caldimonas caldifontis]